MEKCIEWKLMRCTKYYFMYFELDLNMSIIHKLIRNKYDTDSALFSRRFELCKHIPILDYIRRNYCENKRIRLLAPFRCNKYPSHRAVINYLQVSNAVSVENLNKKVLEDSITYLEGNLSFDEIKTPKAINSTIDLILYLWKNA